jgi:hypothetical protein
MWAIKCTITGHYLQDVSVMDESLTITKRRDKALPFNTAKQAIDTAETVRKPLFWPDHAWAAVPLEEV